LQSSSDEDAGDDVDEEARKRRKVLRLLANE
jgi:hypothetical protein